jgi:hypothetical protein
MGLIKFYPARISDTFLNFWLTLTTHKPLPVYMYIHICIHVYIYKSSCILLISLYISSSLHTKYMYVTRRIKGWQWYKRVSNWMKKLIKCELPTDISWMSLLCPADYAYLHLLIKSFWFVRLLTIHSFPFIHCYDV